MKALTIIFVFLFTIAEVHAQSACTVFGQNPETAFPVCGTSVFDQKTVPVCGDKSIPNNCNDNSNYQDKNPFWYKFTCFESGTLGFVIKPNNSADDYDWQLFDVTGHDPQDVYSDLTLFVSADWSGETGNTGASASGTGADLVCSSVVDHLTGKTIPPFRPTFVRMPKLEKGHQYLLLVSHFSGSDQSGYSLSFGGGTAVITDTLPPRLEKAVPSCDGSTITIQLNKAFQCKTLAADGSDFVVTPGTAKVIAAASTDCKSGFDMDSLTLTLDQALPPGDYTVTIRDGTDKNTLLDNCNNGIPENDQLDFTVEKIAPTPMDSIPNPGCAPQKIKVVFDGAMRCGSFAANGSDFEITGPSPVVITSARGVDCSNNLANAVELTLSNPIVIGGRYTLRLVSGSDGNTVLNECNVASPAGQMLIFEAKDTVSAAFTRKTQYECNAVHIMLHHPGGNGINAWHWITAAGLSGSLTDFNYTDTTFNHQHIQLIVSNGVCSDTAIDTFSLNNDFFLKASFEKPSFVCPNDQAVFTDHSLGNISSYQWSFGNGNTSFMQTPPKQQYPEVVRTKYFPVKLIVQNTLGCKDTAIQELEVINNCFIAVPTAFTPNGDGMNDYLYPLNAYKARNLDFRVYNRYGQLVFHTKEWTDKWDGTFHGSPQPMGTFVWMLTYTNADTGEKVFKKGATLLIR